MKLRKVFAGKSEFKGMSFRVLAQSVSAYLLEMRHRGQKLLTYMVVDNTGDEFPTSRDQLRGINPFRDPNYSKAKDEYQSRNQAKLNL